MLHCNNAKVVQKEYVWLVKPSIIRIRLVKSIKEARDLMKMIRNLLIK
jgi:hypothetical protein